jgi:hypothetical protein
LSGCTIGGLSGSAQQHGVIYAKEGDSRKEVVKEAKARKWLQRQSRRKIILMQWK